MNAATLFGLCAAALIGIGLYGLIVNPHPLRKILAFNVVGSGVFLLFGVIARRGAAAGMGGDPVPQALADHRHRRRLFGHRARGRACCYGSSMRAARSRSRRRAGKAQAGG